MIKKLLLTFLLFTNFLFAYDTRLDNYPEAKEWLKDADTNGESAYNIGVIYQQKIKDDKKAIFWYGKAYEMKDEGSAGSAANNLGYIYNNQKKYDKAVKWYKKGLTKNNSNSSLGLGILYKKAYKMGNFGGANDLGLLYNVNLQDEKEGIKWYKKGARGGDSDAINNLGRVYYAKKDNVIATAYILAMVNYGYTKKEVLDFLKNNWKIDQNTLEEAYKLQQTLDIPKHYTGGID